MPWGLYPDLMLFSCCGVGVHWALVGPKVQKPKSKKKKKKIKKIKIGCKQNRVMAYL